MSSSFFLLYWALWYNLYVTFLSFYKKRKRKRRRFMAIKKTTQEWTEVLNEAMSLHAKNAVSNLKFDKTELVEIVDISQRKDG
jgi:hypothetical protein